MSHRLELSSERPDSDTPSALEYYRALREDPDSEAGLRLRDLLEQLAENPGKVREKSRAYRPGAMWLTEVDMPSHTKWWVIWSMDEKRVKVRWIGPDPREFT